MNNWRNVLAVVTVFIVLGLISFSLYSFIDRQMNMNAAVAAVPIRTVRTTGWAAKAEGTELIGYTVTLHRDGDNAVLTGFSPVLVIKGNRVEHVVKEIPVFLGSIRIGSIPVAAVRPIVPP